MMDDSATTMLATPTPRAAPAAASGRLLRIELRRNAMKCVLPVLAALLAYDAYRTGMSYPAIWDLRASVIPDRLVPDCTALVAGGSAWMGARESRRRTADIVRVTVRPGWGRRTVTLAATMGWTMLAYLAFVAVLYGVTASQATWGGPPWWPAAVGAAVLAACCALGFAAGALLPSRFTAPFAAVGMFAVTVILAKLGYAGRGGLALLSPVATVPPIDAGVFRPYLPDIAIAQVLCFGGVAIAAAGAGLPSAGATGLRPAGGRWVRSAAALVTVAGLAAAATAAAVATTARAGPDGVIVPALHDAADDAPIAYTPVCTGVSGVPVCVHPAFRAYLSAVGAGGGGGWPTWPACPARRPGSARSPPPRWPAPVSRR